MDDITIILIGVGLTAVLFLLFAALDRVKTDDVVAGIGLLGLFIFAFFIFGLPLAAAIVSGGESVLP